MATFDSGKRQKSEKEKWKIWKNIMRISCWIFDFCATVGHIILLHFICRHFSLSFSSPFFLPHLHIYSYTKQASNQVHLKRLVRAFFWGVNSIRFLFGGLFGQSRMNEIGHGVRILTYTHTHRYKTQTRTPWWCTHPHKTYQKI